MIWLDGRVCIASAGLIGPGGEGHAVLDASCVVVCSTEQGVFSEGLQRLQGSVAGTELLILLSSGDGSSMIERGYVRNHNLSC